MAHELSRQALYDLVWSKAKTEVAKGFGVSDVAVGKACKKANIPVPRRGYWAMREAQQRRLRTPLPARGLGQSDTVTIGQQRGWWPQEPIGELPPPPEFSEPMEAVIRRAQQMAGKVTVPRNLDRPHLLVTKLLEQDEQRRQKVAESKYYWDKPRFEAPAAVRRLRLINAVFLALARAGCRPDYGGQDAEELFAHVGDQLVQFVIVPVKKGKHYDRMFGDEAFSARLPLRLSIETRVDPPPGLGKEWQDTDKQRLESVIQEAVISIVAFGEVHYRANAISHHEWLVERKHDQEEAIRKARELAERQKREAQLKKEQERRQRLFVQARNWKQAADIREFVAAVREHNDVQAHSEALEAWASWALSEAKALDPLCKPLTDLLRSDDEEVSERQGE
jgi:hypothetical protein